MDSPIAGLTKIQYAALVLLRDHGVGALHDGQGWIWAEDVRTSEEYDVWLEYDSAAEWCAKRGLRGVVGDSLPNLMSGAAVDLINADPEAFEERVRFTAYALAMERHDKYGRGLNFTDTGDAPQ